MKQICFDIDEEQEEWLEDKLERNPETQREIIQSFFDYIKEEAYLDWESWQASRNPLDQDEVEDFLEEDWSPDFNESLEDSDDVAEDFDSEMDMDDLDEEIDNLGK